MFTILVPVDSSHVSQKTIEAALLWGKQVDRDFNLHVLNVQQPILEIPTLYRVPDDIKDNYYRKQGQQVFNQIRPLLGDISYEEEIQVGPVAETIAQYAKQHKVDAIVMGTRGLGAIKGLMLGSVATKVLTLVDIPVTLIK